ncbi:SDR family NAD(P)-dependent oxidoreductase [Bradyrhizobium sp. 187]|uniref:SDR family NAD(P)-dependent oxidoreductase n=1 Tax=Bradyrhizobium sp. 187 TaxID=2782655 RepID=UPI001FFED08C|nr:SDR family NAD(P)-dependent oxidoreductase [Bradyrhizobium sp. 187]UPJ71847.1 SDR family NAD(P)-dependent oxidoreductase [Bradyrhizobium sp. 187]
MSKQKTALILGASRGLGLALAEEYCGLGYKVVATQRVPSEGLQQLSERFPASLEVESVDITDIVAVSNLKSRLEGRTIDTLFVNAGICIAKESTPVDVKDEDFIELMLTNALGPMRIVEAFHGQVPPRGVVAVMSSEIGSIEINTGKWEMYSSSKAALNMLMKCFSARHPEETRALLLVAPGWVRTEMGGNEAILSVEESIPHVVKTVEAQAGKAGLRFIDRHGKTMPW